MIRVGQALVVGVLLFPQPVIAVEVKILEAKKNDNGIGLLASSPRLPQLTSCRSGGVAKHQKSLVRII